MTNAEHLPIKAKRRPLAAHGRKPALTKEFNKVLLVTLLHLPVGVALYNVGSVGLLHPYAVFALGMYWALFKNVRLERIAYVGAYLIGCEVLWRMAGTPIFWEFGKYGTAAIMIAALVKRGLYRMPVLPSVYLALLLPGCLLVFAVMDLNSARGTISSIMSGPFALFVCCWFFSHLKLDKFQLRRLFIVLAIPLLTVAATTLFYTVSSSDQIEFGGESNFATSGGFGPNQVSSMLGLGAFACMASFILFNNTLKYRLFFGLGALFLAAQSVLTFSRGGMYNAIGAVGVLILFQMQNATAGLKKLAPLLLVGVFFLALVFPFLNDFTGGKLQERFEDTSGTKRGEIIESDLQILAENPVFGVGLGQSYEYRAKFLGYKAMTHTEFSRLIAEHGLFGILALAALILMVIFNLTRQTSIFGRSLVAGVVLWATLFMLNTGMRMAAPSLLWGMGFITLVGFPARRVRRPGPPRPRRQQSAAPEMK